MDGNKSKVRCVFEVLLCVWGCMHPSGDQAERRKDINGKEEMEECAGERKGSEREKRLEGIWNEKRSNCECEDN